MDEKIPEKPPIKGRFVKGFSGNPGGRPTTGASLLRDLATGAVPELFEKAMAIVRDPNVKAADRVAMIIHLFDRAAGKAVSFIDVKDSTHGGLPPMTIEQMNKMINGLSNVIEEANKGDVIEGKIEDE